MPEVAASDVLDRERDGGDAPQATGPALPAASDAPAGRQEQAGPPAVPATPVVTPAADLPRREPANDPAGATFAALPPTELPNVADVYVGNRDSRYVEITQVYARKPNEYAIYLAGDVMVEYADDPSLDKDQRQRLSALAPVRAELNALLKGWKELVPYQWKIAYALQLALDGNGQAGKDAMQAIKSELLADRAAAGRLEYLGWAFGASVVMLFALIVASWLHPFADTSSNIWLAAKGGLIGSGFSIALAIRSRSVGLDIDRIDNIIDGILRLGIGVVSAGVLLLLLASGVVPNVKVGEATISGGNMTWQTVLVIGFIAGFLERLVPDLLDKRGLSSGSTAGSGSPSAGSPASATTATNG